MSDDKDAHSARGEDDRARHERLEAVNRSLERHNRELIERRSHRETHPEDAAESLIRLGALLKTELDGATTLDSLVEGVRTAREQEQAYAFLAFALYVIAREQWEQSDVESQPTELALIFEKFAAEAEAD